MEEGAEVRHVAQSVLREARGIHGAKLLGGTPVLYIPPFILLMLIPSISRIAIFPRPDICSISPDTIPARYTLHPRTW
jgi:hypothetical protein